MNENKKPAPEREAAAREKVRITGEIVLSANSMAFEQATDSTGIFTGTVPANLLAENEESGSRVD